MARSTLACEHSCLTLFISIDKDNQIEFEECLGPSQHDKDYSSSEKNIDDDDYCWFYDDWSYEDYYSDDEEEEVYYYHAYSFYLAEEYDFKCPTKGKRGTSAKAIQAKHLKKAKKKQVKACVERKKVKRQEAVEAQLIARKERLRERRSRIEEKRYILAHGNEPKVYKKKGKPLKVKSKPLKVSLGWGYQGTTTNKKKSSSNAHHYYGGYTPPSQEKVLSAQELGVETGAMYDRLMEIMNGGNITPEDFDLLLQLDGTNQRSTLDNDVIKEFDVVTVDKGLSTKVVPVEGRCTICLDPFKDMSGQNELRRLPCGHIFCKACIDAWLSNMSSKCPDLSCYWRSDMSDLNELFQAAMPTVMEEVGHSAVPNSI
jgi:hypothetical protein